MRRKKGTDDAPATGARITPEEVQQVEFRLAFRGYNERDVDAFLDRITEGLSSYIEELERMRLVGQPLQGVAGSTGDAGEMAAVQECGFCCPAVAVAFDDLGWGGGQVGGGQRQLVAVGGADRTAEHDLDGLGFERAVPQAADRQHLPLQGLAVAAQRDGVHR